MNLFADFRYALRMLMKAPGFAGVAILTLAVGIGANTAIFSVVSSVLLRPLPYPGSGRLVDLYESNVEKGIERFTVSAPDYLDWRERSRSYENLAAYVTSQAAWTRGGAAAERITVAVCTRELFATLGVSPSLGRVFTPEETLTGGPKAVILGHALWTKAFGGDPRVIGRTIRLDAIDRPVVGVMPPGFEFPAGESAAWLPFVVPANVATQRGAHYLFVVAKLKQDVTPAQASREIVGIARQISAENPRHAGWSAGVVPLAERITGKARPALWTLLGAVGFVLLIACANVANLLLARGTARQTEIAIRTALGAARGRILRQLLTESLVLSIAGSLLGLFLAAWGVALIVKLGPSDLPRLAEARIDAPVILFAAGLAIATAVIFGLAPALRTARREVQTGLKSGGRAAAGTRESGRLRHGLVVAEIGLSLLLLTGAGLLLRSFARLERTDPGFHSRNVLTYGIALPESKYPNPESQIRFYDALLERTRALPGVRSAAAIFGLPLSGLNFSSSFTVEGEPAPPPADEPSAQVRVVSRDYFRTIGVPLRAGRFFGANDRRGAPPVVLASETAARRFWPAGNAVGHRLRFGARAGADRFMGEIVGIVGDVRDTSLAEAPEPFFYCALEQTPVDEVTVILETSVPPRTAAPAAARVVASLDPDVPAAEIETIDDVLTRALARQKFATLLLTLFASAALLLAAIGTYGVLSYGVSLRRREIGVRAALGAAPSSVLVLILRQGMTLAALGTLGGLIASIAVTRLLSGMLFGVSPRDAGVLITASLLLGAVAAVASGVPAWRAAKISPSDALRME